MAENPDESEMVIAPGGLRPKDSVHHVPPGTAVRRMPDGTLQVVTDPDGDDVPGVDPGDPKGEDDE